ncbi:MAG: o-succinylbenzoate synthase [Thermoleptolyngbya sp. C42_A2020_037]|nr:o-succinylbenzoate synthase [Thermoleptolyngbya sp. C42_A2020_037]
MSVRAEFRVYRRAFRQPLMTAHGVWSERRGILVKLTDAAGRTGYGEIAPLPWFGSETLEAAIALCQSLPEFLDLADIRAIAPTLPACQFGLESAWDSLMQHDLGKSDPPDWEPSDLSALLPAGNRAISAWKPLWNRGHRTFKQKIGVGELTAELTEFKALIGQLPPNARLRLDANGGLDWDTACRWLEQCAAHPQVEFLEQPLAPSQFDAMLKLAERFPTPLALDESVATLAQLRTCWQRGWRGVVVIKAAIAGFPSQLRAFCQQHPVDIVWSSALETAVARRYIQAHLVQLENWGNRPNRALGYGVAHWFFDPAFEQDSAAALWQTLTASAIS